MGRQDRSGVSGLRLLGPFQGKHCALSFLWRVHMLQPSTQPVSEAAVVGKAMLRAAGRLRLSGRELARVLGVSEATLSRLRRGQIRLQLGTKEFELAILFVRLYR